MLRNGGAEIFLRDLQKHLKISTIKQCLCLGPPDVFDENFAKTFGFEVRLGLGKDIDEAAERDDIILAWGNVRLNDVVKKRPRVCVFNACGVERSQIKNCDRIVTHVIGSSTIAMKTMSLGFPATLIHPGVDESRLVSSKNLREELGFSPDDMVVGVASRLDLNKRVEWAIEAVEKCKPNVKALILGEGPERKSLERIGSSKIRFMGHKENMGDYYRCMDVFCLTSINEGCSAALFEAMFMGLPPIVTKAGSVPDLIDGTNGIIIDDVDQIRHAIEFLESSEQRKKFSENAKKTAIQKGKISETARRWDKLFARLHGYPKWKLHQ